MRIITGKYKGRRFDIPRSFAARPTTDCAKENLFNVLVGYLSFDDSPCLDLFAGTGSITLEMLSRGAGHVIAIEGNPAHMAFIRACLEKIAATNCTTLCGDVFHYLRSCHSTFAFIFADPPYSLPSLPTLPDIIFAQNLLSAGGLFVLEHGQQHTFATHPHFVEERIYGKVHFSFFQ